MYPFKSDMSYKQSGKKKALLIGIAHVRPSTLPLNFAHQDAKALRELLITSFGYSADDITLMMDDRHLPKDLWPTQKKILHQIDNLVKNVTEDDHFFFYYSGHGLELESVPERCTSGVDEEIVAADGRPILDHILHDHLITPLEQVKGSKLFALFDCCHSETLLDLQHGAMLTQPNDWRAGIGQVAKGFATSLARIRNHVTVHWVNTSPGVMNRETIVRSTRQDVRRSRHIRHLHGIERLQQSERLLFQQLEPPRQLNLICLAACRYAESPRGRNLTFTKCFLDAVRTRPEMTWVELREELRNRILDIQVLYKEVPLNTPKRAQLGYTREPKYSSTPNVDLTQLVEF